MDTEIPVSDQFLSHIFIRPKKDGSFRPIFNLKKLNVWVQYTHFKMEGMVALTPTHNTIGGGGGGVLKYVRDGNNNNYLLLYM